ncbi:nucleoside 2-deoxyribosyltransferase [Candidatus Roizmanbacteria bacterium]|nr:nucleoside 2-deoxyribosyltransferase [Candidatus Roizmanbacteria bacterium]
MINTLSIYFTAATSYDGDLHNHYVKILSLIKNHSASLLSGEQIVNEELLKRDKKLTQRQIFEREKKLIEESDCVIAEVSRPSLGVGSEITHALINKKPVLALVFEGYEDKISPIIAGNPSESLFMEFYNFDKIPFIIKDFLAHVQNLKKKKGKMIVLEGGDGSGKTTQAKMLVEYLRGHKFPIKYFDFPQYYHSFHAKTVAKFLRGEFGNIDQVSPYLASLAYALDRASAKNIMEDFLHDGGIIIANRYATSNIAHQGAKFSTDNERDDFLKWVYELEYKIHRIPKEDVVIYLHVPWRIGAKLTEKREKRNYLKGLKNDIHETDLDYRRKVETMYLSLVHRFKHWVKIDCVEKGKLLSPQVIHKKIITVLKEKKIF